MRILNMKVKKWLKRCLICGLLALLVYLPFRPVPIVRDPDRARLEMLRTDLLDQSTGNYESIELSEPEQRALLEYLATCRERRILIKTRYFTAREMELRIQFTEWSGTGKMVRKLMGLGEQNRLVYNDTPFACWQHAILNPEEVRAGVLERLGIPGEP